ncbi:MAG: hypothetical protein NTZ93_00705 [Candidatus Beckwithbacteria bacterium]|nr:hypothetical protein [Candidatus Beckwithbacteria bacterium]
MGRFKIVVSISLVILSLETVGLWLGQKNLNKKIGELSNRPDPKIVLPSPTLIPSPSSLASPSMESSPVPSFKPLTTAETPFQPQMIYLGAANTTKTEWTETNLEVKLNSIDYPADVNAVFEAGLSIISGEAWARLKNKTSGAIMSVTEIYNNSNSVVWKTSPSFKLHPGNNVYVVELKSSSSELANLSGARIKISK